MQRLAHFQTGFGGSTPESNWMYYDEMGMILVNDPSINADVEIESHGMGNNNGGTVVIDNRGDNDVNEEDLEIQAARRARARNVNRIPKSVIKEKDH